MSFAWCDQGHPEGVTPAPSPHHLAHPGCAHRSHRPDRRRSRRRSRPQGRPGIHPHESGATAATADAVPASSTVEPAASSGTVTAQSTVATSTTYSETSSRVVYHGTWATASSSRYIGGHVKYSKSRSASAAFSFTGTKVSWIGPVGPTRGKANVYVDGKYIRSVNTYASTFVAQKVLFGFSWASQGAHTLKIVVAGTAGHPMVAIDAFRVTSLVTAGDAPGAGASPASTVRVPAARSPSRRSRPSARSWPTTRSTRSS